MTARRCLHVQLFGEHAVHGLDVVADGGDGESRSVQRFRRVAGRGRTAIAEQFAGDEKQFFRIERLAGSDQPAIPMHLGHVVRGQEDGVVAFRIQFAVRAINDARFGKHSAAFRLEILDDEFVLDGLGIGDGLRLRRLHAEQRKDQRDNTHGSLPKIA